MKSERERSQDDWEDSLVEGWITNLHHVLAASERRNESPRLSPDQSGLPWNFPPNIDTSQVGHFEKVLNRVPINN